MILLFILLWPGCGFMAAGFLYARAQRWIPDDEIWSNAKHRKEDALFSAIAGCSGPISLLVVLLFKYYKHGWLLPGRKP